MFLQNAVGVQTLTVTDSDNAQSQHSQPQGLRSCWSPRCAQRSSPGQALPSHPDGRRALHPLLPLLLPEPHLTGQEKDANPDANPGGGALSTLAGLLAGWHLGILNWGSTGSKATSAPASACRGCHTGASTRCGNSCFGCTGCASGAPCFPAAPAQQQCKRASLRQ